jgi:cysteine synthase
LAAELARTEPNGAIWANQFDNVANRDGHIRTTAQEIWTETGGKVDGFVSAVGTGGTLAGVAIGLREKDPSVKIALADPLGAALHSFYTEGVLKSEGSSITEGIGQGRPTSPSRSPTTRRCRSSSTWCRRRGSASAARRASTSPVRSGSPANSAPDTGS